MSMTRPHATIVIRLPVDLKARIDANLESDRYGFESAGHYTGRRTINSEAVKALEAAFPATPAPTPAKSASKGASKSAGKRKAKRRAVRGPQLALKLKPKRKAARA